MTTNSKLLVTGASGHLGQRVIHHLLNTLNVPANRIIAATRNLNNLSALVAQGVTVRAADFEDAASLAKAFTGVDRMLLISTDALDRPGRRLEQHQSAVSAAAKAGVNHVIYTSMPNPENSPILFTPDHAGTEQALGASTIPGWTILRNHWYFENLFMTLPSVLATGQWYTAAGDGKLANIARDDLARAAATVLASDSHEKTTYTLSGAKALTTAEIAAMVGATLDRSIDVIQVPLEGLIQGMTAAGLPEAIAAVYASFDTNTAAGYVATVTGDYKQITGLDPQPFSVWLTENKAALIG